ncbi:MAG: DUF420 domain-containing protein [Chthoniobacterales bacterium]
MSIADLPRLNAVLNALCLFFLLLGWGFIRRERKIPHIFCMSCALGIFTAFLISYLVHNYATGPVPFAERGWPETAYFIIHRTHGLLALVILPLAIVTIIPAFRSRFDKHRRIGNLTLPIWLYVSVTGVLDYAMLYVWFPVIS